MYPDVEKTGSVVPLSSSEGNLPHLTPGELASVRGRSELVDAATGNVVRLLATPQARQGQADQPDQSNQLDQLGHQRLAA